MTKLNVHKDHTASCHCCEFLVATYEEDYSEITPGAGFELSCRKGNFYMGAYELCEIDLHTLFHAGATCLDFEPKD